MGRADDHFPETKLTLLKKLPDLSSPAWSLFYELYAPIVHRFARHAGLSAHDADEVLANVMQHFMQRVRSGFEVDHRRGRFRSYLRVMTNNEINAQRQRARRQAGTQPLPADWHDERQRAPDEHWVSLEREERLRACLKRLRDSGSFPPAHLDAFEQVTLHERSPNEVAREFGLTRDRVYSIRHAVVHHLRRLRVQLAAALDEL